MKNKRHSGPSGFFKRLGPGLVTGAADDDPSGIGTHSQVGAEFGYGLAWTFVLSFPLMVVIQEVAAQIGRVTGRGIAANVRRHYPRPVLFGIVLLLMVANIINLGADLSAMGAALQLLMGGHAALYTLGFGIVCVVLEIMLPYARYAAILNGRRYRSLPMSPLSWSAMYPGAPHSRRLLFPKLNGPLPI